MRAVCTKYKQKCSTNKNTNKGVSRIVQLTESSDTKDELGTLGSLEPRSSERVAIYRQ